MKYIYWIVLSLVIVGGLGASVYFGSMKPNQAVIEYTQVETPELMGEAVFKALEAQWKQNSVLFLGVTPNQIEDVELLRGFFELVQKSADAYQVLGVEQNLPYVELLESNLRLDTKAEMDRLVQGIQDARAQGLRVAVVMPTIYSTQTLKHNLAAKLSEKGLSFVSLSIAKYPITEEQAQSFDPVCAVEVGDIKGTGPLGCAIRELAQKTYLHKQEPNKFSGMMSQIGEKDYLLIFNKNEVFR